MHSSWWRSSDCLKSGIFLSTQLEARMPSKSRSAHFPLQALERQAFLTPVDHNRLQIYHYATGVLCLLYLNGMGEKSSGRGRSFACIYRSFSVTFTRALTNKIKRSGVDRLGGSPICSSLILLMHHIQPLGRPQSYLKPLEFCENCILKTSYRTPFKNYFSSLENIAKITNWKDLSTTMKLLSWKAAKQVGWKEALQLINFNSIF